MVERLAWGTAKKVVGCDIRKDALDCLQMNLDAADVSKATEFLLADGRNLPFSDQSYDVIFSDLPFGSLVGSHQENLDLYPALLNEAARMIRPRGRFVLITHEVRLMHATLNDQHFWELESTHRVTLRGLHPKIYLLRRL